MNLSQQITGYITLTGDLLHDDHFRLLKACRSQCTYLIVGLVTDKLGVIQKRLPMLTYEHRRSMLEHCKYVDLVVEHNGEPKVCAWEKLKFDILFSSDEYFNSPEFLSFQKLKPEIKIIYFPKNHATCSTDIISQLVRRFCESQRIIAVGITGNIIRYGFGPFYEIIKPLHFAKEEVKKMHLGETSDTSDVFGFYKYYDKLPRNWKVPSSTSANAKELPPLQQQQIQFPMLAGINSARELLINERYKNLPWCTYLYSTTAYVESQKDEVVGDTKKHHVDATTVPPDHGKKTHFSSLLDFAHHVALCRQFPTRILHIVQRDGGITFESWCKNNCRSTEEFNHYVNIVTNIIQNLREDGVVHGDIHPRNILIDTNGAVSIIDFGWVSAVFFEMCDKERRTVHQMLEENFDLLHFKGSLQTSEATRKWLLRMLDNNDQHHNHHHQQQQQQQQHEMDVTVSSVSSLSSNHHCHKSTLIPSSPFQPLLPTINEER